MIDLSTSFVRTEMHYHSQFDTVDKIEPEAVEITLKLGVNVISQFDTDFQPLKKINPASALAYIIK